MVSNLFKASVIMLAMAAGIRAFDQHIKVLVDSVITEYEEAETERIRQKNLAAIADLETAINRRQRTTMWY